MDFEEIPSEILAELPARLSRQKICNEKAGQLKNAVLSGLWVIQCLKRLASHFFFYNNLLYTSIHFTMLDIYMLFH